MNKKRSLKAALFGPPSAKRLTGSDFRKLVLKEAVLIREQDESTESASSGTAFTAQSNFKDFDDSMIDELFAQIKTRDMSQPIFGAMWKADPDKTADWLASKGEDAVRERIKAVAAKIPATGLPKSEMPFLPGPEDAEGSVSDVVDALTPGGDITIDFQESRKNEGNLLTERWGKLAGIHPLSEIAPPAKNSLTPGLPAAEDYLTSGDESRDGNAVDDNANVQQPAQVAAGEAIPTQSNILIPKALGMAVGSGGNPPVEGGDMGAYFSTDNEILDGHHRWAATMLNNPGASIGGFAAIDLKAMGGTEQALRHLTALGNALGNKTKTS
jgi:hypothetical protein